MRIKRFNEAILDYRSQGVDEFYDRIKKLLDDMPPPPRGMGGFRQGPPPPGFRQGPPPPGFGMPPGISLEEAASVGSQCGVEVVDYDTFYQELPESDKKTAPPRNIPTFALRNPTTGYPRVVLNVPIDDRLLDHIYHMLKHETIHIKQASKRTYTKGLPDPNDQKKYFSDTDEIMAFSQSITDEVINQHGATSIRDAINKLYRSRLYSDVKRLVDREVLNKYHKYIYLYLEKEFGPDKNEKNKKEVSKDFMSNFLKRDFAATV